MTKILLYEAQWDELREGLLARRDVETCAIGFIDARSPRSPILVNELAPDDAYAERTELSAVLKPEYLVDVVNRARRDGTGLLLAHSHPFDREAPVFSSVDDRGEARIAEYLDARLPGSRRGSIVVSPGGASARILGGNDPLAVQVVGKKVEPLVQTAGATPGSSVYDRQIRAFGADGQKVLGGLRVSIVGLGGTGSIVAQQLAHLGVKSFVLADFDVVEETNLNRLIGASRSDVGHPKVEIAKRAILTAVPDARVEVVRGDVGDDGVAKKLTESDFIFCCTDSHASRAILNQIAYQYLIPAIDMGINLSVRNGALEFITGRVQLLAPGLPCLTCMDLLDSEQIRRELLTPEARAADPYITGTQVPQPAVITLNGVVSSLATTMFLGVVTKAPINSTLQFYDGVKGVVRNATGGIHKDCLVCSRSGALARGNYLALPTRTK